jgi:predicted PurR-regulated permease PerM
MPRSSWLNLLIILLTIIAATYVAQVVLQLLSGFADILLILILSWLIAYALGPLVESLHLRALPAGMVSYSGRLLGPRTAARMREFRVTRVLAVGLVYLSLAIIVVIIIASLIPATLAQLAFIAPQLSRMDIVLATVSDFLGQVMKALGFRSGVEAFLDNIVESLNQLTAPVLQNTVTILTTVISLLGNALLVILLSFFIALDGPRFMRTLFTIIPDRWHQETRVFLITVDRAFGSFLRAQVLQAVVIGIITGIVMTVFSIQAALVSALFAALFMLIPLVGPVLSLIPPLLATLLTDPGRVWIVMILLAICQVALVNVIMPRMVGNALGLHPLVIIVSLLIGVKLGGFWGAFFAMPIAGIISAFGTFLFRRRQRLTELTHAIVQRDEPRTPLVGEEAAQLVDQAFQAAPSSPEQS